MKQLLLLVLCAISIVTSCTSCGKDSDAPATANNNDNVNPNGSKMNIKIGSYNFTATLYDNSTANAFKSMLPITVSMAELNGNEKYYDLSRSLPANASNPRSIQTGDLMLYGSNTLVLFYKTFSTSFSYTRIGRIDNEAGLANALGSGNVSVTFELE
ncbi:cyclophilin-like fold protein [Foetidibacter luteolus]|uniref:cyclophilin-like fold protein n=1 Tax=Foetidibacter luteolus TaxID=2608880 RepID=UPI00129AAEFC|nr:cyclophilin-like fold protein [Foetidibacter luteolus]